MKKKLGVKLVIYKNCTETHGQQNIKFYYYLCFYLKCYHKQQLNQQFCVGRFVWNKLWPVSSESRLTLLY